MRSCWFFFLELRRRCCILIIFQLPFIRQSKKKPVLFNWKYEYTGVVYRIYCIQTFSTDYWFQLENGDILSVAGCWVLIIWQGRWDEFEHLNIGIGLVPHPSDTSTCIGIAMFMMIGSNDPFTNIKHMLTALSILRVPWPYCYGVFEETQKRLTRLRRVWPLV